MTKDTTYTVTDVLQILRNVGVDTDCGACMETAFCGFTQAPHDCKTPRPVLTVNEARREHGLGAVRD